MGTAELAISSPRLYNLEKKLNLLRQSQKKFLWIQCKQYKKKQMLDAFRDTFW